MKSNLVYMERSSFVQGVMQVVPVEQLVIVGLNGITFAMLLFLLTAGLELIFGVMDIVNLAHGSFYVMGAYVGVAVVKGTDNFLLGILAGMGATALLGLVTERFLFRYAPTHLRQVLLTFGLIYILADSSRALWGGDPTGIFAPAILATSVKMLGWGFPAYRLALIVIGLLIALGLWVFQERTRLGAVIRAGVDDKEMVAGLGINIKALATAVFTAGALLAGFAGVIGTPVIAVYLGLEWEILTLALVVLVVGGVGSLRGALVGSLLIGLADSFGKLLIPQAAMFLIFALMALVLVIKPSGLFGRG